MRVKNKKFIVVGLNEERIFYISIGIIVGISLCSYFSDAYWFGYGKSVKDPLKDILYNKVISYKDIHNIRDLWMWTHDKVVYFVFVTSKNFIKLWNQFFPIYFFCGVMYFIIYYILYYGPFL